MTSDGPRMENSTEAEAQRDPQDAGDDERDEGKAEGPAVSGCPRLSRSEVHWSLFAPGFAGLKDDGIVHRSTGRAVGSPRVPGLRARRAF